MKQFSYIADVEKVKSEYCNRFFLKMENPPNESSGPVARVWVQGGLPDEGCQNGGMAVRKYVDQLVLTPEETTVLTYIVNFENQQKNSSTIQSLKDVLPQGGVRVV